MGLFGKIWRVITNDEQKWMRLTELCPYCDNYFGKKNIKEHIKVCSKRGKKSWAG